MVAPLAGEAVTFWNAPVGVMAGLMDTEVAPEAAAAVTTNCCGEPVSARDCGLTALTPARVNTVPTVSVPLSAAVVNVLPVWLAPDTVLVLITAVPLLCRVTFWSIATFRPRPSTNMPDWYCLPMVLAVLNKPAKPCTMLAFMAGLTTMLR